ncbi:MAG: YegS/Rv2252/BmrU family lipid kinase [Rikenellaceae bacterium]
MKKEVLFVYNPYSGENKILGYFDTVIHEHQQRGYTIVPFRLDHDADLVNIFQYKSDYEYVIAAGGDGTINSVVNVMKKNNVNSPLAVLPVGTANDFAKLVGISSHIPTAIRQIVDGVVKEVDLGLANDKYFVNVLSIGLFTDISQKTPTALKNTFGKLAYYMTSSITSLQELPKFSKLHIDIKSDEVHYNDNALILFVFNGRTAGNFKFAYRSDIQDGKLDVLVIKGENIAETLQTAFHFMSGVESNYPKGVVHFKAKELSFNSVDNLTVDVDGEVGPRVPMEIKCVEKGLKLIVPDR